MNRRFYFFQKKTTWRVVCIEIIKIYFSSLGSSRTLFGFSCSKTPRVTQKGKIKPIKNNSIQNAIPPISKNNTIPKTLTLILLLFLLLDIVKLAFYIKTTQK
tara:strand:- start:173 stop:478 length:306 start_codon:yes stop_codon:yes gene_type:complete